MFLTFLKTELQRLGVETQNLWFQQGGATAHTVRTAMRVHNEMFSTCVISQRGNTEWPAKSPNLNTCDFFLWGYLKSKVHGKKPETTVDLKQNIREAVATVLQRVIQNFQKRLRECVDNNGRHLTDTIFRR